MILFDVTVLGVCRGWSRRQKSFSSRENGLPERVAHCHLRPPPLCGVEAAEAAGSMRQYAVAVSPPGLAVSVRKVRVCYRSSVLRLAYATNTAATCNHLPSKVARLLQGRTPAAAAQPSYETMPSLPSSSPGIGQSTHDVPSDILDSKVLAHLHALMHPSRALNDASHWLRYAACQATDAALNESRTESCHSSRRLLCSNCMRRCAQLRERHGYHEIKSTVAERDGALSPPAPQPRHRRAVPTQGAGRERASAHHRLAWSHSSSHHP